MEVDRQGNAGGFPSVEVGSAQSVFMELLAAKNIINLISVLTIW